MYDLIKLSTREFTLRHILEIIEFASKVNEETGEILSKKNGTYIKRAAYKGLKLTIKTRNNLRPMFCIEGSLHRFHNDGGLNYDDFTFSSLQESINKLTDILKINAKDLKIDGLEYGVNIIPPVETINILNGLLSHKNMPFNKSSYPQSQFYYCEHDARFIKAYNKALQASQNNINVETEIFRFENRYRQMREVQKLLGSHYYKKKIYLDKLRDKNLCLLLQNDLIKTWKEIIFFDFTLDKNELQEDYYKYSNRHYWDSLTKMQKYRLIKKMNNMEKHYSSQVKQKVEIILTEKMQSLIYN